MKDRMTFDASEKKIWKIYKFVITLVNNNLLMNKNK